MARCVIVGGAPILDYERLKRLLVAEDFFIYCDSGLLHQEKIARVPDLIVGDFDSHARPEIVVETIVLPREKDDTDTVFAVREALRRGFDDFLFIGVVGARLDHTLANVSLLLLLADRGLKGKIIDDFSEMEIVSKQTFIPDTFAFFSLLNISGVARGITINNAKYPLTDGEITCQYQYGVSNEVLPGKTAEVKIKEGKLLLIKIFKGTIDNKVDADN